MSNDFSKAAETSMQASKDAWATSSQKIQDFTKQITEMSKQSFEHASATLEKMTKVKSFEELLSIQSAFLTEALQATTERTRKMGEMMSVLPMEMGKAYKEATSKTGAPEPAANQPTHEIINH